MNHRVRDFDAGRVAVNQDSSHLALKDRQPGESGVAISLGQEYCRGQLSVEVRGELAVLADVAAADNQRSSAENFVFPDEVGEEASGVRDEKRDLADTRAGTALAEIDIATAAAALPACSLQQSCYKTDTR